MNYLDILFVVPLLWGLYKGITRGLIVEAATLAAFFLAVWVAIHFCDWLTGLLSAKFGAVTEYLPLIAFAVLFLGVLVLVFFVAKMAERTAKSGGLSVINKLFGAVFGMLKFALIISLFIFIFEAVERSYPMINLETKQGSLLYEPISKVAPAVIPGLKETEITRYIPVMPDTLRVNVPVTPP
ncbi:MAG: CvpA family protein [Bacteroidia bacterium]|nr:CvpA family protein [Bacteroidia bacterium]